MKNYPKKAFSLIEISIVILIIGLLIAGISKATDMLADSRLKSARSIARGSIVPRLSNLVLWLDVSQAESWPDSKRGTQTYSSSTFTDLNPQSPPNIGFKFSGDYAYTENNGSTLPYLAPAADISAPADAVSFNNLFDLGNKGFTIFVVAKQKASQPLFSFCSATACATAGKKIIVQFDASKVAKLTYPKAGGTVAAPTVEDGSISATGASTHEMGGDGIDIISVVTNTANPNIFSLGGKRGKPGTATEVIKVDTGVFVLESGAQLYEVIVVGEFMEDSMRQKVEKYLFDKYSVPVDSGKRETGTFSAT